MAVGADSADRFHVGERIGEGTFGAVFRGTEVATGRTVAVKRFHAHWMGGKAGIHFTALREVRHLNELRHPNIVELLGVIGRDAAGCFSLVFEWCVGDLEGVIRRADISLRAPDVKAYMAMLTSAVAFLHANGVLHRDLKPANVLVAPSGALKLADFGTARALETAGDGGEMTPDIVTRWYQCPELLLGARRYGPPVDVWSLGCVFAELHLRRAPFAGTSTADQLVRICAALGSPTHEAAGWADVSLLPDFVPMAKLPPAPLSQLFSTGVGSAAGATVPAREALQLIGAMLSLAPARRVACADALQHAYFAPGSLPRATDPADLPLARR
ncbi:hypothetical protein KFE25_004671 [Diacronema lutheri]|uniref:[RNA-polymerase]-subunit kinase n=1 Tax=Diacronema lutheri TaxID=2081491 RepID=A0A8J6CAK3_DIALT|nr:hypothetical protein KFE25_004671 [Diacronema lutheri]